MDCDDVGAPPRAIALHLPSQPWPPSSAWRPSWGQQPSWGQRPSWLAWRPVSGPKQVSMLIIGRSTTTRFFAKMRAAPSRGDAQANGSHSTSVERSKPQPVYVAAEKRSGRFSKTAPFDRQKTAPPSDSEDLCTAAVQQKAHLGRLDLLGDHGGGLSSGSLLGGGLLGCHGVCFGERRWKRLGRGMSVEDMWERFPSN